MSQLRRAMMRASRKSGSELPAGYTAYDWVECNNSTGSPCINTGLTMEMNRYTEFDRWEAEGKFAKCGTLPINYTTYHIFANSIYTYDVVFNLGRSSNKTNRIYYMNHTYYGGRSKGECLVNINDGEWHTFKLTHRDDAEYGGRMYLDGIMYEYTSSIGNYTNKELYLLGIGDGLGFPCRLAELKIYEWGNIVADLVPAMRDADGVVGFYDVVRKIFCEPSIEGVQLLCGNGLENFSV